jgi:hypothetical protein
MNNNIKRFPMAFASIGISLALIHCLAFGSNPPPAKGAALPEINLLVPDNSTHRNYLGLRGAIQMAQDYGREIGKKLVK